MLIKKLYHSEFQKRNVGDLIFGFPSRKFEIPTSCYNVTNRSKLKSKALCLSISGLLSYQVLWKSVKLFSKWWTSFNTQNDVVEYLLLFFFSGTLIIWMRKLCVFLVSRTWRIHTEKSEIRAARDNTLVLLYAKNFFTERAVCKRRMVGEENSPWVILMFVWPFTINTII